jgi:hypothetical protein
MSRHDAVILEEPPDPSFVSMLSRRLGIDDYLETLDLEYPEFGRLMCSALRELHHDGKRLYQIDPFMEILIQIHDGFADGGSPSDLAPGSDIHRVYLVEREATAALIGFYSTSVQGTFKDTVAAVKRFSRADARRLALRDRMRADAISGVMAEGGNFYIEAGPIHYPLWRELKERLPPEATLAVKFLMADTVRDMGLRGHLYGPGDLLTLLHRFHPHRSSLREDLLAARALVYNKLIAKEEITDGAKPYPHIRDELMASGTVRGLSLSDCRRLFPLICRASTATARETVRRYLAGRSGAPAPTVSEADSDTPP